MAKKSLGQNFLLDPQLLARIARAGGDLKEKHVIEIGPGPGGLTRALLDTGAHAVHAIERDDRCIEALQSLVTAANGRLILHAEDALKVDYETICPAPRALLANLPYNIATPLLVDWLEKIHLFDSLTLMFQREVADRLTAVPRSKEYGRISILAQWLCHVEKKFDIPPGAFLPPPKITSSVVHFVPRDNVSERPLFKFIERATGAAFGQRRKMLRQSLKSLGVDTEKLMTECGITPTARAEEIDVAGFVRLAQALAGLSVDTKS